MPRPPSSPIHFLDISSNRHSLIITAPTSMADGEIDKAGLTNSRGALFDRPHQLSWTPLEVLSIRSISPLSPLPPPCRTRSSGRAPPAPRHYLEFLPDSNDEPLLPKKSSSAMVQPVPTKPPNLPPPKTLQLRSLQSSSLTQALQ